jgi:lipid-binding SYLF domain-containing protein
MNLDNLSSYLLDNTLAVILIMQQSGLVVARAANKDTDEGRLKDCGAVLKEVLDIPDNIPQDLLNRADCVVVYPSVLKAAFVIGGSYGRGAMTCRKGQDFTGSWGAPTMMALEGGSFGFQIGGQATDFVLLVMNESGARGILAGKVKLGGDVSIAAGPGGDRRDPALRDPELFPFPRPVCRDLSRRLNHPPRQ